MHVRSLEDHRPKGGFYTKYFQVKKDSGDDAFVQRLSCPLPDLCLKKYEKRSGSLSIRNVIARLLLETPCLPYMKIYQQLAMKANNYSFFDKAVQLAAIFVSVLYSEEALRNYCCEDRLQDQLNELWEYVSDEGKKVEDVSDKGEMIRALAEVWKNTINRVNSDLTDKYSLVQETHVSNMIDTYAFARDRRRFDPPYHEFVEVSQLPLPKEEPSLDEDIRSALSDMECVYGLTVDDHTRLLVLLARGKFPEIDELVCDFDFTGVYTPTIDNDGVSHEPLEYLRHIFYGLASHFRYVIWEDMLDLISPWDELHPQELFVNPAVCEVFQVAELRRRALGRRFFTHELFMWSFYKLGYALPPAVRDTVKLRTDKAGEDHALSQILRAATKLVVSLGAGKIELEHVLFVVVYPKEVDVDIDIDVDAAGAYIPKYMDFMQAVEMDRKERRRKGKRSEDDFNYIFEGDSNKLKFSRFKKVPLGVAHAAG